MTHVSLLSRYADRLGLSDSAPELHRRAQGSCAQIVELLDEILVAHTHSICFENLDVVAFRAKGDLEAVAIDVDGAAGKLLTDGRGGYCHEHASLIRGVVTELGLRAHPILARVHLGDGQTAPGALTHQATIVDLDGRRLTHRSRLRRGHTGSCARTLRICCRENDVSRRAPIGPREDCSHAASAG